MSDESDAFLDGAGLLGRPLSVGKDPPCLLKQNPMRMCTVHGHMQLCSGHWWPWQYRSNYVQMTVLT